MKRITILLMTLMLTIIQMTAQDTSLKGTITLSHQGKETTFAYNEMIKVMDTAADGDTIFLSAGYFQGDFIVTKKLAFIGVGADYDNDRINCTSYDGKILINLPENTTLSTRLFDGIHFYDNNGSSGITFNSAIDNVIFRKCRWGASDFWQFQAEIKNLIVDRCYCNLWQNSTEKLTKLIVRNSNVSNCYIYSGDPNSRIFYNCNISTPGFGDGNGYSFCQLAFTYINCIIFNDGRYLAHPRQDSYTPILINCLYNGSKDYDVTKNCTLQNCYAYTSEDNSLGSLTKEDLLKSNYLGNDGTVVGYYGGKNPYTLKNVTSPTIKNTIHLDKDKKQIQFNLKITEQQ